MPRPRTTAIHVGKPCPHCQSTERYDSNNNCVRCVRNGRYKHGAPPPRAPRAPRPDEEIRRDLEQQFAVIIRKWDGRFHGR